MRASRKNGSGKSIFAFIFAGIIKATKGDIYFEDQLWKPRGVLEARKNGVAVIVQEAGTIENISVAENIFLGQEMLFSNGLFISRRKMFEADQKILDELEVTSFKASTPTYKLDMHCDKEYIDQDKFDNYTSKKIYFVSRLKDNAKINDVEGLPITCSDVKDGLLPKESKIMFNEKVRLGNQYINLSKRIYRIIKIIDSKGENAVRLQMITGTIVYLIFHLAWQEVPEVLSLTTLKRKITNLLVTLFDAYKTYFQIFFSSSQMREI